jgi:hypothetical protein
MRTYSLFAALLCALLWPAARLDADLKAVFAFNERVVSIVFPEFNYGITTTVDKDTRQIAITFPKPLREDPNAIAPHMEISLESLSGNVDGTDYYQQYLSKYQDKVGTVQAAVEEGKLDSLSFAAYHKTYLLYRDSTLQPHKMLMITAIDGGTGIVIVLDTLAAAYDSTEGATIGILNSVHFEY